MWEETASATFLARHDARDRPDAQAVLAQLERARPTLERRMGATVGDLEIVFHSASAQLDAAAPWLVAQRRLTAPTGRRYLAGWAGERTLHVLAPRLLAGRASNVAGSLEALMLTPVALLARRIVGEANPRMPPPLGLVRARRALRWAWLLEGAAQHLAGQGAYRRAMVGLRLRTGPAPHFPPVPRDATVLGASVLDLLARQEGEAAVTELIVGAGRESPERSLVAAFSGRPLRQSEQAWRSHLARLPAGPGLQAATTSRATSVTAPSTIR